MKQQDGRNLKVTSQKKEAFFQIEIVQKEKVSEQIY